MGERPGTKPDLGVSRDPIAIMIVDDHEVMARGLADLFGREPDMEVVATAHTVLEAIPAALEAAPEVLVLDYRLSDGNGLDVCKSVRRNHPGLKVILYSAFPSERLSELAQAAGCAAVVSKGDRPIELVRAVRIAAQGGSLFAEDAAPHRDAISRSGEPADPGRRLLEALGDEQPVELSYQTLRSPLAMWSVSAPAAATRPATAVVAARGGVDHYGMHVISVADRLGAMPRRLRSAW